MLGKKAGSIMTPQPKTISKDDLAATALRRMEEFSITSLFILDDEGSRRPVGIIHMHDLLRAGVA
jgi:arabinose-5-phosphate isomerase